MKYVKILGLLALAATALMAFAATASATRVTAPEGTLYTSTIEAERVGPKALTLHGVADVTCTISKVKGKVESHGSGVTAKGTIENLTFENCDQHVKVLAKGTLEAHYTSGRNGTLRSSGAEVTVEFTTIFGNVHCVFATNGTNIGNLVGASSKTTHATLEIASAAIPVKSGGALCGSSAEWTGTYTVTNPVGLILDA